MDPLSQHISGQAASTPQTFQPPPRTQEQPTYVTHPPYQYIPVESRVLSIDENERLSKILSHQFFFPTYQNGISTEQFLKNLFQECYPLLQKILIAGSSVQSVCFDNPAEDLDITLTLNSREEFSAIFSSIKKALSINIPQLLVGQNLHFIQTETDNWTLIQIKDERGARLEIRILIDVLQPYLFTIDEPCIDITQSLYLYDRPAFLVTNHFPLYSFYDHVEQLLLLPFPLENDLLERFSDPQATSTELQNRLPPEVTNEVDRYVNHTSHAVFRLMLYQSTRGYFLGIPRLRDLFWNKWISEINNRNGPEEFSKWLTRMLQEHIGNQNSSKIAFLLNAAYLTQDHPEYQNKIANLWPAGTFDLYLNCHEYQATPFFLDALALRCMIPLSLGLGMQETNFVFKITYVDTYAGEVYFDLTQKDQVPIRLIFENDLFFYLEKYIQHANHNFIWIKQALGLPEFEISLLQGIHHKLKENLFESNEQNRAERLKALQRFYLLIKKFDHSSTEEEITTLQAIAKAENLQTKGFALEFLLKKDPQLIQNPFIVNLCRALQANQVEHTQEMIQQWKEGLTVKICLESTGPNNLLKILLICDAIVQHTPIDTYRIAQACLLGALLRTENHHEVMQTLEVTQLILQNLVGIPVLRNALDNSIKGFLQVFNQTNNLDHFEQLQEALVGWFSNYSNTEEDVVYDIIFQLVKAEFLPLKRTQLLASRCLIKHMLVKRLKKQAFEYWQVVDTKYSTGNLNSLAIFQDTMSPGKVSLDVLNRWAKVFIHLLQRGEGNALSDQSAQEVAVRGYLLLLNNKAKLAKKLYSYLMAVLPQEHARHCTLETLELLKSSLLPPHFYQPNPTNGKFLFSLAAWIEQLGIDLPIPKSYFEKLVKRALNDLNAASYGFLTSLLENPAARSQIVTRNADEFDDLAHWLVERVMDRECENTLNLIRISASIVEDYAPSFSSTLRAKAKKPLLESLLIVVDNVFNHKDVKILPVDIQRLWKWVSTLPTREIDQLSEAHQNILQALLQKYPLPSTEENFQVGLDCLERVKNLPFDPYQAVLRMPKGDDRGVLVQELKGKEHPTYLNEQTVSQIISSLNCEDFEEVDFYLDLILTFSQTRQLTDEHQHALKRFIQQSIRQLDSKEDLTSFDGCLHRLFPLLTDYEEAYEIVKSWIEKLVTSQLSTLAEDWLALTISFFTQEQLQKMFCSFASASESTSHLTSACFERLNLNDFDPSETILKMPRGNHKNTLLRALIKRIEQEPIHIKEKEVTQLLSQLNLCSFDEIPLYLDLLEKCPLTVEQQDHLLAFMSQILSSLQDAEQIITFDQWLRKITPLLSNRSEKVKLVRSSIDRLIEYKQDKLAQKWVAVLLGFKKELQDQNLVQELFSSLPKTDAWISIRYELFLLLPRTTLDTVPQLEEFFVQIAEAYPQRPCALAAINHLSEEVSTSVKQSYFNCVFKSHQATQNSLRLLPVLRELIAKQMIPESFQEVLAQSLHQAVLSHFLSNIQTDREMCAEYINDLPKQSIYFQTVENQSQAYLLQISTILFDQKTSFQHKYALMKLMAEAMEKLTVKGLNPFRNKFQNINQLLAQAKSKSIQPFESWRSDILWKFLTLVDDPIKTDENSLLTQWFLQSIKTDKSFEEFKALPKETRERILNTLLNSFNPEKHLYGPYFDLLARCSSLFNSDSWPQQAPRLVEALPTEPKAYELLTLCFTSFHHANPQGMDKLDQWLAPLWDQPQAYSQLARLIESEIMSQILKKSPALIEKLCERLKNALKNKVIQETPLVRTFLQTHFPVEQTRDLETFLLTDADVSASNNCAAVNRLLQSKNTSFDPPSITQWVQGKITSQRWGEVKEWIEGLNEKALRSRSMDPEVLALLDTLLQSLQENPECADRFSKLYKEKTQPVETKAAVQSVQVEEKKTKTSQTLAAFEELLECTLASGEIVEAKWANFSLKNLRFSDLPTATGEKSHRLLAKLADMSLHSKKHKAVRVVLRIIIPLLSKENRSLETWKNLLTFVKAVPDSLLDPTSAQQIKINKTLLISINNLFMHSQAECSGVELNEYIETLYQTFNRVLFLSDNQTLLEEFASVAVRFQELKAENLMSYYYFLRNYNERLKGELSYHQTYRKLLEALGKCILTNNLETAEKAYCKILTELWEMAPKGSFKLRTSIEEVIIKILSREQLSHDLIYFLFQFPIVKKLSLSLDRLIKGFNKVYAEKDRSFKEYQLDQRIDVTILLLIFGFDIFNIEGLKPDVAQTHLDKLTMIQKELLSELLELEKPTKILFETYANLLKELTKHILKSNPQCEVAQNIFQKNRHFTTCFYQLVSMSRKDAAFTDFNLEGTLSECAYFPHLKEELGGLFSQADTTLIESVTCVLKEIKPNEEHRSPLWLESYLSRLKALGKEKTIDKDRFYDLFINMFPKQFICLKYLEVLWSFIEEDTSLIGCDPELRLKAFSRFIELIGHHPQFHTLLPAVFASSYFSSLTPEQNQTISPSWVQVNLSMNSSDTAKEVKDSFASFVQNLRSSGRTLPVAVEAFCLNKDLERSLASESISQTCQFWSETFNPFLIRHPELTLVHRLTLELFMMVLFHVEHPFENIANLFFNSFHPNASFNDLVNLHFNIIKSHFSHEDFEKHPLATSKFIDLIDRYNPKVDGDNRILIQRFIIFLAPLLVKNLSEKNMEYLSTLVTKINEKEIFKEGEADKKYVQKLLQEVVPYTYSSESFNKLRFERIFEYAYANSSPSIILARLTEVLEAHQRENSLEHFSAIRLLFQKYYTELKEEKEASSFFTLYINLVVEHFEKSKTSNENLFQLVLNALICLNLTKNHSTLPDALSEKVQNVINTQLQNLCLRGSILSTLLIFLHTNKSKPSVRFEPSTTMSYCDHLIANLDTTESDTANFRFHLADIDMEWVETPDSRRFKFVHTLFETLQTLYLHLKMERKECIVFVTKMFDLASQLLNLPCEWNNPKDVYLKVRFLYQFFLFGPNGLATKETADLPKLKEWLFLLMKAMETTLSSNEKDYDKLSQEIIKKINSLNTSTTLKLTPEENVQTQIYELGHLPDRILDSTILQAQVDKLKKWLGFMLKTVQAEEMAPEVERQPSILPILLPTFSKLAKHPDLTADVWAILEAKTAFLINEPVHLPVMIGHMISAISFEKTRGLLRTILSHPLGIEAFKQKTRSCDLKLESRLVTWQTYESSPEKYAALMAQIETDLRERTPDPVRIASLFMKLSTYRRAKDSQNFLKCWRQDLKPLLKRNPHLILLEGEAVGLLTQILAWSLDTYSEALALISGDGIHPHIRFMATAHTCHGMAQLPPSKEVNSLFLEMIPRMTRTFEEFNGDPISPITPLMMIMMLHAFFRASLIHDYFEEAKAQDWKNLQKLLEAVEESDVINEKYASMEEFRRFLSPNCSHIVSFIDKIRKTPDFEDPDDRLIMIVHLVYHAVLNLSPETVVLTLKDLANRTSLGSPFSLIKAMINALFDKIKDNPKYKPLFIFLLNEIAKKHKFTSDQSDKIVYSELAFDFIKIYSKTTYYQSTFDIWINTFKQAVIFTSSLDRIPAPLTNSFLSLTPLILTDPKVKISRELLSNLFVKIYNTRNEFLAEQPLNTRVNTHYNIFNIACTLIQLADNEKNFKYYLNLAIILLMEAFDPEIVQVPLETQKAYLTSMREIVFNVGHFKSMMRHKSRHSEITAAKKFVDEQLKALDT